MNFSLFAIQRRFFRAAAWLTAASVLLLTLQGCVSTRAQRYRTGDSAAMAVQFAVYLKKKDFRQEKPVVPGVLSELHIERDGRWELLQRSEKGAWTYSGLIPGKYRLEVVKWAKAKGEIEELGDDNSETFTLKPGESAKVNVILEKTPTGLIIVLSVTVVVLIAVLIYALAQSDGDISLPSPFDLPVPPIPAPEFLDIWLPPPDVIIAADFEPPPHEPGWETEGLDETPLPAVMDYSPLDGDPRAALDSKIWLQFSAPIDGGTLDHRNFIVETADQRPIPGGLYFDQESKLAVFHPLQPLPSKTRIQVTVYGQALRSPGGQRLEDAFRWNFTTR